MSDFIGVGVLVTLKDGAQLQGTVHSIVPQVSLTLRNVYSALNGATIPEYTLDVQHISTLETDENANPSSTQDAIPIPVEPGLHNGTVPAQDVPAGPRTLTGRLYREPSPPHQPEHVTVPKVSKFEDPAILSMGKRPSIPLINNPPTMPTGPKREHAKVDVIRKSPKPIVIRGGIQDRPISPKPKAATLRRNVHQHQQRETRQSRPPSPAANLIDPASFSRFTGELAPKKGDNKKASLADVGTLPKYVPENSSALPKVRRPRRKKQSRAHEDNAELADQATVTPAKETKPSANGWRQTPLLQPTASFQPYTSLRQAKQQKNGWGTEDASDVQDMGEFDFESNHLKFDKNTVFEEIKAEDMTEEKDRLHSHNRVPKPGTAGGKNLHYTENVLDTPKVSNGPVWNSEASDEEITSHKGSGSGRTSRIAGKEHLLNRRSNSRKASSITSSLPNSRPQTSVMPGPQSSFYLIKGNRKCDVVSALQALNLENIANSELGLTEDMMTENAARGIAEVALSALNSGKRRSAMPIVVVYAGNGKSGNRAVAAGRHLRNHGVHVIVCVLAQEAELLEDLRRQLKVFRNFGGKVFRKADMLEHLKTLDTDVELIIDGLLGLTMTIEELRTGDQATVFELITWANNRSKANVLAIDVPTGIDPTSGKIAIIEGSPLYLNATYVVSMSAPKKGLLQAMIAGEGQAWQLFVADIGIADAAWKKGGTRMRRGVEFDQEWVVGLRFQHQHA